MPKSKNKGFTLVENLVILVIIGFLILFSFLSAPSILARARDAVRKNNIDRVAKAVEEYYEDTNCYPTALPVCGNPLIEEEPKLLANIPCDPKTKTSYVYVSEGGSCPSWFQLYGNLEYTQDSIIDRLGCRNGCGPDCQFNYGEVSSNQKLNPFCELAMGEGEEGAEGPDQYVCAPSGECEVFEDPEISGCPDIYPNDPTCQNQCEKKINTCHDERGKIVP